MARKPSPNKTQKATNKAGRKAGVTAVVPQPHGGAIWQGPPANPVAGTGRPPAAVRAALVQAFDERRPILERIADDLELSPGDRVRAIDLMAKYGLGTKDEVSVTDHPQWVAAVAILREELEAEFGPERVDAAILRAQAKLAGNENV